MKNDRPDLLNMTVAPEEETRKKNKLKDVISEFKIQKNKKEISLEQEVNNLQKLLNARKDVRQTIGYMEALSMRFLDSNSAH